MIVTAIRLYLIYKTDFNDLSFSIVQSTYLTIIQPGIAMMVACGPLLKPIMARVIATPFGSQQKASTNTPSQERSGGTGSTSRKLRRWPELSILSTTRPGFSRMSESVQDLPIELHNLGRHEAHVSAHGDTAAEDGQERGSNGGILITHQTIVADSRV